MAMKSSVFWDIMPCSSVKVNQRFGGTYRLHLQGQKVSQARNKHEAGSKQSSLTLNMEAIYSPKMSVYFHHTTWCYIPEDITHSFKQTSM
jgi:hypothetical protein